MKTSSHKYVAAMLTPMCKAWKKDRSLTEAMTNDDVELISHAPYIAIQVIKNREIEGYR